MIYHFKSLVLVRKGRAFYTTLYQAVFFGNPGGGGSLKGGSYYIYIILTILNFCYLFLSTITMSRIDLLLNVEQQICWTISYAATTSSSESVTAKSRDLEFGAITPPL